LDVLVNQPPLSGNFRVEIAEDAEDKPYVLASLSAPFWEDAPVDQPYGYRFGFVTQRGSVPFVAERARKNGLASVYMPRGFSNNVQALVAQVADGRGGEYEQTTPMPGVNAFSSSLCPSGVDEACQILLVNEYVPLSFPFFLNKRCKMLGLRLKQPAC
jgi:hypothetical protein